MSFQDQSFIVTKSAFPNVKRGLQPKSCLLFSLWQQSQINETGEPHLQGAGPAPYLSPGRVEKGESARAVPKSTRAARFGPHWPCLDSCMGYQSCTRFNNISLRSIKPQHRGPRCCWKKKKKVFSTLMGFRLEFPAHAPIPLGEFSKTLRQVFVCEVYHQPERSGNKPSGSPGHLCAHFREIPWNRWECLF